MFSVGGGLVALGCIATVIWVNWHVRKSDRRLTAEEKKKAKAEVDYEMQQW